MDNPALLNRQWRTVPLPATYVPSRALLHTACTVLVLASLMPYPGLPVGNNTGLEIYDAVMLALIPIVLIVGIPRRHLAAFLLFLVPSAVSATAAAAAGRFESINVGFAVLVGLIVAFVALLPAGMLARAEYFPNIIRGVTIAIAVHVAAGAYQVYAFAHGFFPFLGILRNPNYMPLAPVADNWVQYIKRPFGLFPEPSAMAAALVPWLVVTTGLVLYPQMSPVPLARFTRLSLLLVSAGGVWLVIWSRSGFIGPMIAVLVVISLPRARMAATQFFIVRRLIFILLTLAAVWMMVIFAQTQFGHRLETANSVDPWADRRSSLEIGLRVPNTGPENVIFGVGPGQSTIILQETKGLDTVWSVTIRNYADTGLFGLFGMVAIGAIVARAIFMSNARFIGTAAAFTWLFGITIVTSYGMNSVWFFLAMLLAWDKLFPAPASRRWAFANPRNTSMHTNGVTV